MEDAARAAALRRPAGARARSSAPASALATAAGKGDRREVEFLRRGALGQPVFWGGAESFTEAQKQSLLSPRLRRELDGLTSWDAIEPIRRRFEAKAWERFALSTG